MNSPGWAKALVGLFLLSASIGLIILTACQSSPAEFNLQYACLDRSLPTCSAAEEFADRVADRTDGRVQIEIVSLSGLALGELGVLQRLKDGTLDLGEIQARDFVAKDDRALLDILDLLGLYRDYETQAQVNEAIRKDIEGVIADRSGGVVLAAQFYPSHYFFTKKPLRTAEDFRGLRIRSHNTLLEDLLAGMGAIPYEVAFGSVYQALESDLFEAAVSCGSCGAGLMWYKEAGFLVGPIPVLGHSWIAISSKIWLALPPDIQLIIREEAMRHETATKESSLDLWDERGVRQNISAGMEHIELTPELKELMRTAALTTVLPNWASRAGGPTSNPVILFNERVAPIVKVEISQDGTVKEIK